MLPLTRPGLVTAVIFTFIAAWNEYVVALTLIQDDAKKPLTVGINSYVRATSRTGTSCSRPLSPRSSRS